MYRVTLSCSGLSSDEGKGAPPDILEEFGYRPWQLNATCTWDGAVLRLQADNQYDATGESLLDEFRDSVVACIDFAGDIRFEIESVVEVAANEG